MESLAQKEVLVLGLEPAGAAVCELLRQQHAEVTAIDLDSSHENHESTAALRKIGVHLQPSSDTRLPKRFDLAVVSAEMSRTSPLLQALEQSKTPIVSELEFGYRNALCLLIAISGANGKSTTAALLHHLLNQTHFKTALASPDARPLAALAEQTKTLDFLLAQVDPFQLNWIQFFRPIIAVLLNWAPAEGSSSAREQALAQTRLFQNQQAFDWAILQSETLARLQALQVSVPSKTVTFSATDPNADLYLDHGLIISRLPGWTGPLLDLDQCPIRGEHNAENLMAVLAVCRVLRIPLDQITPALKTFVPLPGRFQLAAQRNGVQFINDQQSKNLLALRKALHSFRAKASGPSVWLIAGGDDPPSDFHDLGPELAQHVRHAFLLGKSAEKIRAAWGLFTPCTLEHSLLEAITKAAQLAAPGDVILFSPACPNLGLLQDEQFPGERFASAVEHTAPSTGSVPSRGGTSDGSAPQNSL